MKSSAEMPQKDLTVAEKIFVLRKIREQPPNTSHRQLAEITGVPKNNPGTDTARFRIIWSAACSGQMVLVPM